MKCGDCAFWDKTRALSKDWCRCSNPDAKTFNMWMESKNTICKVGVKKDER